MNLANRSCPNHPHRLAVWKSKSGEGMCFDCASTIYGKGEAANLVDGVGTKVAQAAQLTPEQRERVEKIKKRQEALIQTVLHLEERMKALDGKPTSTDVRKHQETVLETLVKLETRLKEMEQSVGISVLTEDSVKTVQLENLKKLRELESRVNKIDEKTGALLPGGTDSQKLKSRQDNVLLDLKHLSERVTKLETKAGVPEKAATNVVKNVCQNCGGALSGETSLFSYSWNPLCTKCYVGGQTLGAPQVQKGLEEKKEKIEHKKDKTEEKKEKKKEKKEEKREKKEKKKEKEDKEHQLVDSDDLPDFLLYYLAITEYEGTD